MASLPTGGERLPDEGQQRMRSRQRTSARPPAGQATEADMIGNYKLGQEIGRGSFAGVFRGHHKLAAIKRVDKKRFKQETSRQSRGQKSQS
ncbi:hypothetical protein BZA77DRAFT_363159 [Pyronema omphalodes]|nr:hypothetical protein BZA77DRAFT_363159 [Pyronema omphalodes]